jgi:tight adherence protein C
MSASATIPLIAFTMVSSLVLLVYLVISGRQSRLDTRLQELAGKEEPVLKQEVVAQIARSALPRMGTPLIPSNQEKRTRLQARLIHAGLYGRQAMPIFLGVKMLLILAPALVGLAAGLAGLLPLRHAVIFGALLGAFGMIGPSFWLDYRKGERQVSFRRALPDAFDVLVICLEGGLSLPAAFRRVSTELRTAHPRLAAELNIMQREIQLGKSAGEALRLLADRTDLEEIRTLASVVIQSERFGASLVKSLRVQAEILRTRRLHYAEQTAQKAAIKILFPTILFIFPAVFIVVLGPAAFQVVEIFRKMRH